MIEDVRRLGAGEVVGVVNTHEHFDHTFGNAEFRTAYGAIPIHAHETAPSGPWRPGTDQGALRRGPRGPPPGRGAGNPGRAGRPPSRPRSRWTSATAGSSWSTPAAATPAGDLVVRVPDADVLLAGDLVEESGPPGLGDDSYPLEWPLSLDIVLGLTTAGSVVVPGHGAPVDRDFVEEQRNTIGIVAETIRDLATRGVSGHPGARGGRVALPARALVSAVRRGYEHLPPAARSGCRSSTRSERSHGAPPDGVRRAQRRPR